ncbi:Alpha/beta hydrolase fold-1 [Aspergillus ambiguus]|uniref:alpha/beta hydrolase n=1 Tax=Aspergillus ambiguus TaxID=176160 RepID=UPI003CCDC902
MAKPVLIFAPGAWHLPTAFDPLVTQLRADGYPCDTVAFPSIQHAREVTDLSADIAAVRALVEPAVAAGQDVVIVAHSWAGVPVNSALEGLSKTHRAQNGAPGGVVRTCFISAFLPVVGESVLGAAGGTPPDWWVFDSEDRTVTAADPLGLFYHDVPNGREWAERLRPHAKATKVTPAEAEAYLHVPSAYLLCEADRAIPLAMQEAMVERVRAMGAVVETERIGTGHTPWLVRAEEVADFIRRYARA